MKYQDYRTPREVKREAYSCLTEGVDKFYAETLKCFHLEEQRRRRSARQPGRDWLAEAAKWENRRARLEERKIFRPLFTPFLKNVCPYILKNFNLVETFVRRIVLPKVWVIIKKFKIVISRNIIRFKFSLLLQTLEIYYEVFINLELLIRFVPIQSSCIVTKSTR